MVKRLDREMPGTQMERSGWLDSGRWSCDSSWLMPQPGNGFFSGALKKPAKTDGFSRLVYQRVMVIAGGSEWRVAKNRRGHDF